MKVDEALLALSQAELSARFIGGEYQRIIGGTEVTSDLGIDVYKKPFAIYQENADWVVAVSGPGQFDTISQARSLEEAVEEVCRIYYDVKVSGSRCLANQGSRIE
jgi:hypothetical protein